jgi:rhamnosyltransferase
MTSTERNQGPVEPVPSSSVVGVVSAFNPDHEHVENIAWLLKYVTRVVVVDDGSSADVDAVLEQMRALGADVLRLERNSGIACALNTGVKHARASWDPEWIVTMDQDSRFSGDYVAAAMAAAATSADPESIGMVCAESHNHAPLPVPMFSRGEEPEVFDPMTSGSLVPSSTFDTIGYYNEDYFIDCVDSEFNARIRAAGLRAIAAPGCNLNHSLGHARPMKILGWHAHVGAKKLFIYYHSPFRVYYITRNSLVMARTYIFSQPVWVLRRIYMEIQSHVVRFVFGPNRRKHLRAASAGIRDALRHRMGRIDDALASRLR